MYIIKSQYSEIINLNYEYIVTSISNITVTSRKYIEIYIRMNKFIHNTFSIKWNLLVRYRIKQGLMGHINHTIHLSIYIFISTLKKYLQIFLCLQRR